MEKKDFNLIKHLDYLLPLIIWLLIFGKNLFSNLMSVDYVPSTFPDSIKFLYMGNFNYVFNGFDFLKLILYPLNLLPILFTLSILITMLVSYFYIKRTFKSKPLIFSLLFAFIYFFNPFVYTRIIIGQIGILVAYLLIPVFLFYLLQYFKSNLEKKAMIKMILAMTIVSLFAIHFFAINFIIFLTASFWFYFYRNKKESKNKDNFSAKKYLFSLILIIIILILLNLFWIQGIFSSGMFSTINTSHENFFSPKMSMDIPAVAKIIGMWGFWRENSAITSYLSLPIIIWYAMLFALLIAAIIGFLNYEKKKSSYFFFTLFWVGVILGTGISHPYTRPFFDFLFNYLPLFNGFRDSHKLVSLVALAYAFLIPSFLLFIKEKEKCKRFYFPLLIIIIFFLLLFTFPLLGLWNQVHSASYPNDYFQANNYLNNQTITGYVIYLPWQTYLTYNWTKNISSDGRISAPVNHIINQPVLIGSDEWGSETQLGKNISDCLSNQSIQCLEEQDIQFIIKDKCAYYPDNYSWISNSTYAVFNSNCIDIYKISNQSEISKQKIPLRFIMGVIISIITLIVLIIILAKKEKEVIR